MTIKLQIKVTQKFHELIEELVSHKIIVNKSDLIKPNQETFDVKVILEILNKVKDQTKNKIPVWKYLMATEIILPKSELPPRSIELDERIQRLKNEQDNKEYAQMVQNVSGVYKKSVNEKSLYKELNEITVQIFNVLMVIVCSFIFAYVGSYYMVLQMYPGISDEMLFQFRLLAGCLVGSVVFVAELYFIIKHFG